MFRLKDVKAVKLIGGSPELWLFSQTVMSKVGIGRDRKSRSRKVENWRRMRLDRSTLPEGKRTETKSRLSKFHIFAGPRTGDDETGIDIADERRFFVVFLLLFFLDFFFGFTLNCFMSSFLSTTLTEDCPSTFPTDTRTGSLSTWEIVCWKKRETKNVLSC